MGLLKNLPPTRHDLSSPDKFSIDSWTLHGLRTPEDSGILIIVHGEFEEVPTQPPRGPGQGSPLLKRSFDRSMTIIPNVETGAILMVSDTLTVRSYAGSRAWSGK